ncbi:epithelial membrane protein 3 [Mus caroli]|uniref:Epithelial membrane protein 3 n=2 Tax=Mus TaxID=862507 RepID=A0A6P5Q311_MUSCR|nr:epithelial membrane protein 3 [Mus caroli]XP_021023757.1 epithelial membrane protein 3 [Mus caroli]
MSLLLLVVSALHILILVLLFVATLDKSWWTLPDKESLNLWYDCTWNTTTQTWACSNVSENGWLKAVQALMVLSLILCCLSFILFMFQLYTMRRGGLFYATGLCQLCTSAAVFSGALIYAIHTEEILAKHPSGSSGGSFGYCFALAWVAFPLALVSGIVYIHLRKRE